MMGAESNRWDGCFWQADVDEAARDLLEIIREVRPQVIVSYDDNGFYGHPDHIQAHRVAWRAYELAEGQVARFYATAMPKSVLAEAMALMRESGTGGEVGGGADFTRVESVEELPFGTDDANVTTEIDATDYLDAKLAAMRAHATQIAVDSPFFALSDKVGRRALGTEYYTLLAGPSAARADGGRESDLFAGLWLAVRPGPALAGNRPSLPAARLGDAQAFVAGGRIMLLFVLGAMQALIGTFQFSRRSVLSWWRSGWPSRS